MLPGADPSEKVLRLVDRGQLTMDRMLQESRSREPSKTRPPGGRPFPGDVEGNLWWSEVPLPDLRSLPETSLTGLAGGSQLG